MFFSFFLNNKILKINTTQPSLLITYELKLLRGVNMLKFNCLFSLLNSSIIHAKF